MNFIIFITEALGTGIFVVLYNPDQKLVSMFCFTFIVVVFCLRDVARRQTLQAVDAKMQIKDHYVTHRASEIQWEKKQYRCKMMYNIREYCQRKTLLNQCVIDHLKSVCDRSCEISV